MSGMVQLRKVACALVFVFLECALSAQHRLLLKTVESITEKDFEKAQNNLKKLQDEYSNTSYESAVFYFLYKSSDYSAYNPDLAYTHLKNIEAQLPFMSGEDIETFCLKLGFSAGGFFSLERELADASWFKVVAGNNWQDANAFFNLYKNELHHTPERRAWRDRNELNYYIKNDDLNALKRYGAADRVANFRLLSYAAVDSMEFGRALSINSEQGWSNYLQTHSTSSYANAARDKYELLVFSNTKSFHDPDSLNRYLKSYPKGRFVNEALRAQEEFWFEKIRDLRNLGELKNFKVKYPHSLFAEEVDKLIEDLLWENAITMGNLKSYATYLEGSTRLNHQHESESKMLELWNSG